MNRTWCPNLCYVSTKHSPEPTKPFGRPVGKLVGTRIFNGLRNRRGRVIKQQPETRASTTKVCRHTPACRIPILVVDVFAMSVPNIHGFTIVRQHTLVDVQIVLLQPHSHDPQALSQPILFPISINNA